MGYGKYILVGKKPIEVSDLLLWGRWMEQNDRHVSKDMVGRYRVSTVFLGLDHNYMDDGEPILFESMVFDHGQSKSIFGRTYFPSLDEYTRRWQTWDEAEAGHRAIVEKIKVMGGE